MSGADDYQSYLERHREVGGRRKRLDEAEFDRLGAEFDRLELGMDPDDVLLDEWKRIEELRFLLILSDDEDEP